jgi:ABC-type transport system involved in multi-copper enzyme maturation permease subunit
MNPMIRKELRQRMRERRAWLLPTLYLLVLGGVIVVLYMTFTSRPVMMEGIQVSALGQGIFLAVAYAQLSLLLLVAPVFSAGAVTIEKEQRTLAGLLTSLLSPTDIWWGKLAAALLYQGLLLVAGLPVLALTLAFGGVGPRELGIALVSTAVVVASISATGLWCSSFFRRSVHATSVTYAIIVALSVLPVVAYAVVATLSFRAASPVEPSWLLYPMTPNPFYTLSIGLFGGADRAGLWLGSLGFYVLLGVTTGALAVRNIARLD